MPFVVPLIAQFMAEASKLPPDERNARSIVAAQKFHARQPPHCPCRTSPVAMS